MRCLRSPSQKSPVLVHSALIHRESLDIIAALAAEEDLQVTLAFQRGEELPS